MFLIKEVHRDDCFYSGGKCNTITTMEYECGGEEVRVVWVVFGLHSARGSRSQFQLQSEAAPLVTQSFTSPSGACSGFCTFR